MAKEKHHFDLFGVAGYYHRPTCTLYVIAEYLVDALCMPRTAESCVEVLHKECQRFAEEYPEKPLRMACVMPLPGLAVVEVTEGGAEEQRWTTTDQEGGPHGAA